MLASFAVLHYPVGVSENNTPAVLQEIEQCYNPLMVKQHTTSTSPSLTRYQKIFKNITLLTVCTNIPYAISLILGIFAPLKSGAEALLLFMPIILIGWCFALVYLFYFPYYIIRYKQSDVFTKIGAGMFTVTILVLLSMVGYMLYLASAN